MVKHLSVLNKKLFLEEKYMKIKTLSFAILTSLSLIGCGGGSSNSDNNSTTGNTGNTGNSNLTTPEFQQWTSFYVDEYSEDQLDYEIEQSTFENGKAYLKVEETTGWDSRNTFFLTSNGLYEAGAVHQNYGKLQGTVLSNNNTWKQIPNSPINSSGLSVTTTFKVIDIGGKKMAPLFNPANHIVHKYGLFETYHMGTLGKKFYEKLAQTDFPAGAKCIQYQDIVNSEDYIELYKSSLNPNLQPYLQSEWKKVSVDLDYSKKTFKDAIAYIEDDEETGLAQYQNNIYEVDFYKKGTLFNAESEINELKKILADAPTEDRKYLQELIDLQQASCSMFNDTASKALHEQIQIFKK